MRQAQAIIDAIATTATLSRSTKDADDAGTPVGLIVAACKADAVALLDRVDNAEVAATWPLGPTWQASLGYRRFVKLRAAHAGKRYALVASPPDG